MNTPSSLCIMCKGAKNLCGCTRVTTEGRRVSTCPLLAKIATKPTAKFTGENFFGPSVSVFIGRYGYPNVFTGPMASSAEENTQNMDNPAAWFGSQYEDVIKLRSALLRSKNKQNIFSRSRFVQDVQDLTLASRPTDVEMLFKSKPIHRISFSSMTQPMGPSVNIKKLSVAENPRIPQRVERIVTDELLATQQATILYEKGQDVYRVTRILSAGILGTNKRKKLVPTRWSITAVHTMIANHLIKEIKNFRIIDEYRIYSSEYLGNYYQILLIPGSWEFENFEAWSPGSFWAQNLEKPHITEEYESYKGRTTYAETQAGGYYANRIGVCEGLKRIKRQARVVVFREISEKYIIPVGVWQCLENVRNAFRRPYMKFKSLDEALKYLESELKLPVSEYRKKSKILQQRKLYDFLP